MSLSGLADYSFLDGLALAELVRRGETTPAELSLLAAEAAERLNPALGAVVETFADRAAAARPGEIPGGPFRGVPFMLKDLGAHQAGVLCESGSRLARGYVAENDTVLGRRFREAGLVTVGRATTSEFGIAGATETLAVGRTCTPWSPTHMAGGSSGGSGAVVGAGIVPVAHGSDGGGSIRIPASACGVVGLKPTRGRISLGPRAGMALSGWSAAFVMTRSVRDTAAALDAVHGPAPGDPLRIPPPGRPFLEEAGTAPGRLRIAWCAEPWAGTPGHPEVRRATEETAALLAELGHDVVEARPPLAWEPFLAAMTDMWAAHTAHGIQAVADKLGRVPGRDNLEPVTLSFYEHGRRLPIGVFLAAQDHFNDVCRRVAPFFEENDALLTPTLADLPARLGTYDPSAEVEPIAFFGAWARLECFLPLFNLTGQPAISLPLCESAEGLPIGMQLVTRFGDEATLFRLAGQLEEARPWSGRQPPIHAAVTATPPPHPDPSGLRPPR